MMKRQPAAVAQRHSSNARLLTDRTLWLSLAIISLHGCQRELFVFTARYCSMPEEVTPQKARAMSAIKKFVAYAIAKYLQFQFSSKRRKHGSDLTQRNFIFFGGFELQFTSRESRLSKMLAKWAKQIFLLESLCRSRAHKFVFLWVRWNWHTF